MSKRNWFIQYGAPERLPRIVEWVLTRFGRVTGRSWFVYRDLEGRRRLWFGRYR